MAVGIVLWLLLFLNATALVHAADFGTPIPGQHVYDRAGVLDSAAVAALEAQAGAVEQAGVPIVVYLQRKHATHDDTVRDGRALMDAWDIESKPNARDGIVLFLNLEPNDPKHGQFAIIAGKALVDQRVLSQSRLNHIAASMRDTLRSGDLANGIAVGLQAVAADLAAGPEPPSQLEQFALRLALPFVALSCAMSAALVLWRLLHSPRRTRLPVPTVQRPDDLPPALAGALVAGRIPTRQLFAATILDLARRGALAIEPVDASQPSHGVQIRLLRGAGMTAPFEQEGWRLLQCEAHNGVVPRERMSRLLLNTGRFRSLLRDELVARGWFDPAASPRRHRLLIGGTLDIVVSLAALLLVFIGQPWEMFLNLAVGLLVAILSVVAFALAASMPETSALGELAAAPWRAYRAGLLHAWRHPDVAIDLDEALPYAVALGATHGLNKRLQEASKQGYSPAWFLRPAPVDDGVYPGFYPYWVTWHASFFPAGSSGAESGVAGGASAGSGSAGGSF
jgi:uncharacterized membrane protein YgcG